MPSQHGFHCRHGELKLPEAFFFVDDDKFRVPFERIEKSLDPIDARTRLRMFQQSNSTAVGMLNEMLSALHSGEVIVGDDGAGDVPIIGDARVDGNDGNVREFGELECGLDFFPIDGIDEDHLDAARDEFSDLLDLMVDVECRIASDQSVAVILDGGSDFFVNDLVERIVECHVDGSELASIFILPRGIIMPDQLQEHDQYRHRTDHEKPRRFSHFSFLSRVSMIL